MAKYRKKPVVIDAVQWRGPEDDAVLIDFLDTWPWHQNQFGEPCIQTLESGDGVHIVSAGDFVIRGVANEYYPCKPDIFAATYELVEEEK